jgi:hypothetical protein
VSKAEAWEAGWEACANYLQDAECDPAHWDQYHANPYLDEDTPKQEARKPHPNCMAGR